MNENQTQEPTQDDVLRSSKLKLFTGGGAGERQASLAVDVFNGNPSLIVYTNVKGDEGNDNGRIRAPLDPIGFSMLSEMIKLALRSEKTGRWELDCLSHPKSASGERSKEPQVTATIMVSRRQDGMITLTVASSDTSRPKIEFPFQIPANRYIIPRIRGDESPAITINHLAATSWVNVMGHIVATKTIQTYKAPPKPENAGRFGGNGGGGRFRQNGSGGGGYQKRPQQGGGNNYNNGGGARKEFDDADFD